LTCPVFVVSAVLAFMDSSEFVAAVEAVYHAAIEGELAHGLSDVLARDERTDVLLAFEKLNKPDCLTV